MEMVISLREWMVSAVGMEFLHLALAQGPVQMEQPVHLLMALEWLGMAVVGEKLAFTEAVELAVFMGQPEEIILVVMDPMMMDPVEFDLVVDLEVLEHMGYEDLSSIYQLVGLVEVLALQIMELAHNQ